MKSKIKLTVNKFAARSSIPGIVHSVNSIGTWKKLWIAITIFSLPILSYIIFVRINEFKSRTVQTNIYYKKVQNLTLPKIWLCRNNAFDDTEITYQLVRIRDLFENEYLQKWKLGGQDQFEGFLASYMIFRMERKMELFYFLSKMDDVDDQNESECPSKNLTKSYDFEKSSKNVPSDCR